MQDPFSFCFMKIFAHKHTRCCDQTEDTAPKQQRDMDGLSIKHNFLILPFRSSLPAGSLSRTDPLCVLTILV